ncbi:hypothetical protein V1515DRAFT_402791 [Lipomyces mesembrius]
MQAEIEQHETDNPMGGPALKTFREAKHQAQAKHVPSKSPYTISIPMQVRLCTVRAYQRLWNDKASTVSTIIGQISMALIIGSIFFGTPPSTAAFFAKGSVLFFAILLNALLSITEINRYVDGSAFQALPELCNWRTFPFRVFVEQLKEESRQSY